MFGKNHSDEAKKIIGKASSERSQGADNSNAKTWEIIDPNGKQYIVKGGIESFAQKHGVSGWTLAEMAKKPHYQPKQGRTMGWQCRFI